MGLRNGLLRGRGSRVLLLAGPDATGLRIEAEAAVRRLSGVLAMTPADADVVLETGELSGSLRAAADVLWAQVPEPRSRLVVTTAGAVEAELRAELRRFPGAGHADGTAAGDRSLPMADRGEDRDGLMLDVLHLPLGPFLPHWPAGLVVDVELQGDVVQQARARDLTIGTPGNEPFWSRSEGRASRARRTAAAHLDSLARLLAVAGWRAPSLEASALRDRLLDASAHGADAVVRDFQRLRRRVEHSRLLRSETDGVGVLAPDEGVRFGVGGPAARADSPWDATARWRQWLVEIAELLDGRRPAEGEGPRGLLDTGRPPSRALLNAAVALMPGLGLAEARVLMASFDPDPEELVTAGRGRRV